MFRRFALLCGAALLCAPGARASDFRIVESVPEASDYGATDTARTQDVWLQMIRGARHSVDAAVFYITEKPGTGKPDGPLSPVLDALVARARAGVKVRLLLDKSFMHETEHSLDRLRNVPNLDIAILPMDTLTGGVLHAKYMIVDGRQVFVGSQNWDWRALQEIHEVGAEITDDRFGRTFEAAFDEIWSLGQGTKLGRAQNAAVLPPGFAPATQSNPVLVGDNGPLVAFPAFRPPALSPAWVTNEQPALVDMIHAARHSFRLQVMTLSALKGYGAKGWWPEIDGALRDAAARGVAVEIIVADWSLREPGQSYLKSLAALPNIAVKFSTIPEAPSGFIPFARVEHCKYAVADDDAVYIGTGNWEWSYFNNTVDASVFVHGAGPAATLNRIFDHDWNGRYVTVLQPGGSYHAPKVSG